jgi:hypothetical protein
MNNKHIQDHLDRDETRIKMSDNVSIHKINYECWVCHAIAGEGYGKHPGKDPFEAYSLYLRSLNRSEPYNKIRI